MAEEEIIILEGSDDESASEPKEQKPIKPPLDKKKKLLFIAIAGISALLLILVVVILLVSNSKEAQIANVNTQEIAEKLSNKTNPSAFSPSNLENMIKKANLLYERGDKKEALKIYKKISTFNEGISYYNLGVAKMRDKNYKEALESFKKAINNGEQLCVSAINAAVSALELGEQDIFRYYIDLAFTYLPYEANSPLYSYYTGLIHYYKDYYYEALSAFLNPSSPFYKYEKNYNTSKIFTSLGMDNTALNLLELDSKSDDALTRGLLYAKIGSFDLAQKQLQEALQNTDKPLYTKSALMLVQNRLGQLSSSADIMKELEQKNQTKIYPIKTILNEALFDVNLAQAEFDKTLFFDDMRTFSLLFYFAPFKVFDAKQTVDYIRKGGINVYLDQIAPALAYLGKSTAISKVNTAITAGITKALAHHTELANQIFLNMMQTYPKHSILQYNLALTYAQMSDFSNAYKYFAASYHLDTSNYLAGIFAIFSATLLKKDVKKLIEDVKSSIDEDMTLPKENVYMALLHLVDNNQLSMTRWLESDKEQTPLHLVFDTIIAQKIYNESAYRQRANSLQSILPKDIMANIINFNVQYKKGDIKEYAKAIQIYFTKLPLDYAAYYYGPRIVQEQYIKLLQIGGLLHVEREKLKSKVELERDDIPAITQTLAYLSIYTHDFEEAYTLYNKIIDDFKKNDSQTVFLAAVASIGARHIENAIALLELSKLIDPNNIESRYALGLAYQEVDNFNGATIQYNKIGNRDFKSKYFSFEITR